MKFYHHLFWLGFVGLLACADEAPNPSGESRSFEVRDCTTTIGYDGAADDVAVIGEFNEWEEQPLEEGELHVEIEPGEYAFAFVEDGEREAGPPADVYTKWLDGEEYRNLRVEDCQKPAWRVEEVAVEDGALRGEFHFVASASEAPIDEDSVVVEIDGAEVDAEVDVDAGVVTFEHSLSELGKYTIVATASDTDGTPVEEDLWIPTWHEEKAFSWQDGLMYLVFTDRFRNADDETPEKADPQLEDIASYRGGDFQGVTNAIEEGYFEELGVNVLWLSPVYENPVGGFVGQDGSHLFTGYHGYWPTSALSTETYFGGDEELRELVEAAHERGIRIVFDIVLNHVHEDHTYCQESPEWCAKTCVCGTENCAWEGPEGRPLDCQFAPYLPDLSYRNHAVLKRVVDDVLGLVRKFDVDGLRIDAAKHMDHVIMRTLRMRIEELEGSGAAPFYLVGETFTGDRGLIMDYVADHELHGQFDFPLMFAIRSVFAQGGSFQDLDGAASASQSSYGEHYEWMSPFLGNHDIPRFATVATGTDDGPFGDTPDLMAMGPTSEVDQWDLINRMSMAFAFLLTQPGVPLIYYGDEVGLAGAGDPDNRRMMPESLNANQLELLGRVQELGKARRDLRALRHGSRKELWKDGDFYVFVRDDGQGGVAIVGMNKSDQARTEEVTIPNALGLAGAKLEGVLSEYEVPVIEGTIQLTLDPWQYVILIPSE